MNLRELHRRLLKDDKIPLWIRVPLLFASSWFFQSVTYMDSTERLFKLGSDFLGTVGASLLLALALPPIASVFTAWAVVHTFNWVLNGQIPALMKNLGWTRTEARRFAEFLKTLCTNASECVSIDEVLVYGSYVREGVSSKSDIDLRVIRRRGVANGISACLFVARARARALLVCLPLDIYVFDEESSLKRMSVDETPVVLYRRLGNSNKDQHDQESKNHRNG